MEEGGGEEPLAQPKIYFDNQYVKYLLIDCQDKVYVNDPVSVYSGTGRESFL